MPSRAGRAVAVALCLLSAACTIGQSPHPTPSPSTHPPIGATALRLLEADDPQTLDPALVDDPVSLTVGDELFEGLTRLDPTGRPVPGLAERWEVSTDARTYTFHFRSAHYRSGAAVRAQDALAAWTRALAPATASPLTVFFAPLGAREPGDALTTVDVVDARTLRVRLPEPDSELLTLLSMPPYWVYDPAATGTQPDGSGPYRLVRWDHGRTLHLETWDGYWGRAPQVRTVDLDIEPDSTARLDRFRAGGADIVHGLTGPDLLAFARDPQQSAELHRVPTPRTTWLGFNTIAGSGYGPQNRVAIAQAIDRRRLTDLALFGSLFGEPATDFLPPAMPGHVARGLPPYDPAAAQRTLHQAGFAGPIDLYFSSNSTVGRVARELQDQLSVATGLTVSLHPLGDFFNRASLDQLPLVIDTWSADVPFPSDILDSVLRSDAQFNTLHLSESQLGQAVDTALEQGRAATTFDDALKAYQGAEGAVLDDTRVIPLYSGVEPYLVRSGLRVPFRAGLVAYRWEDVS